MNSTSHGAAEEVATAQGQAGRRSHIMPWNCNHCNITIDRGTTDPAKCARTEQGARRWRQQLFLLAAAILISPAAAYYSCSSDSDCQYPGCNDNSCSSTDSRCVNGYWKAFCVNSPPLPPLVWLTSLARACAKTSKWLKTLSKAFGALVLAPSGRRNLILTRAVALGDPRGRKQRVSALPFS